VQFQSWGLVLMFWFSILIVAKDLTYKRNRVSNSIQNEYFTLPLFSLCHNDNLKHFFRNK